MGLVWDYAEASKNEAWKGLTWGMLPLHARSPPILPPTYLGHHLSFYLRTY